MLTVVDGTPEHIEQLLAKPLRQDDIDEWFAATGGRDVPSVLREGIKLGLADHMRALLNENGECICLWGCMPGMTGEGIVWLLATQEMEPVAHHVHRFWPREVALMHMRFSLLVAIAYGNNEMHLKWLKAIGFTEINRMVVGPGRLPFITFVREMQCVLQ